MALETMLFLVFSGIALKKSRTLAFDFAVCSIVGESTDIAAVAKSLVETPTSVCLFSLPPPRDATLCVRRGGRSPEALLRLVAERFTYQSRTDAIGILHALPVLEDAPIQEDLLISATRLLLRRRRQRGPQKEVKVVIRMVTRLGPS